MLALHTENIQKTILTYTVNNLFDIILTEEDGELVSSTWINYSKIKNSHLCYMDKNQLNECIEKMRYSSDFPMQAAEYSFENKIDILISGNALKENCYFYVGSSFMLFDYNGNAVSLPFWFDGFSQKVPDCKIFKKIIEKLQSHPYVKELQIDEVKYYNADFQHQMYIKRAKVYLPDETYSSTYKLVNNSTGFHDLLRLKVRDENTPDIYGILDILLENENIQQCYENE